MTNGTPTTYKSASALMYSFLTDKGIGYKFRTKALYEELITLPGNHLKFTDGAVCGWVAKQRDHGALIATRTEGERDYEYEVVDPSLFRFKNITTNGGVAGRSMHVDKRSPDAVMPKRRNDEAYVPSPPERRALPPEIVEMVHSIIYATSKRLLAEMPTSQLLAELERRTRRE